MCCVCMYKCACVYCVSVLHVCMSVHEYACVYISVYMCVLYKCVCEYVYVHDSVLMCVHESYVCALCYKCVHVCTA